MIIMLRINMIWHDRHSMLKYLNRNIIDEGIIITLKNQSATKRLSQITYDFLNI
jgi:hypothetical protein